MPIGPYPNWDACESDQKQKLRKKHPDWTAERVELHAKRICGWMEHNLKGSASIHFQAGYEPLTRDDGIYVQVTVIGDKPSKEEKQWPFHSGPIGFTANGRGKIAESLRRSPLRGPKGPLELGHDLNYVIAERPIQVYANGSVKAVYGPITDTLAVASIRSGDWFYLSGKFTFKWDTATLDDDNVAWIDDGWVDFVDFVDKSAFPEIEVNKVCSDPKSCLIIPALAQLFDSHSMKPEGEPDSTDVRTCDPTAQRPAGACLQTKSEGHIENEEEKAKLSTTIPPPELTQEQCEELAAQMRSKYDINEKNSKKSQFLYAPTDKFSDWKFPVRSNAGKLVEELVRAAIKRLHMTSEAIQRIVRPKLRRLAKQLGIEAPSLEARLEGEIEEGENDLSDNIGADNVKAMEKLQEELKTAKASLEARDAKLIALEAQLKEQASEIRTLREQGAIGVQTRYDMKVAEVNKLQGQLKETAGARADIEKGYRLHLAGDLADKRITAKLDKPAEREGNVETYAQLSFVELDRLMKDADSTIEFMKANGILTETWGAGATTPAKHPEPRWTVGDQVPPRRGRKE